MKGAMEMIIYSILALKNDQGKLNSLLAGMKGISDADIFPVSYNEITAIVSDIKKAGSVPDKSNAIDYAGVIDILAQQFTLLPMRFGSVMESTAAIVRMLERNYHEIQHNLKKVENKFEFGLKVLCDSEKLKAELQAETEADIKTPANPDPEIKHSFYRDYVNQKLKEHRLEELLLRYVDKVIAVITEYLARLKAVSKFKKMLTETTIIDAVFLLKKESKDPLINEIGELQKQYPGLSFVLTGPWPPYNFVEITLK